jgi:serine/threonine-protein kinase
MLAGRRLFQGETDYATVRLVRDANIPSIRAINSTVAPELERIILKALARDRDQRYQTANDLGEDLTRFLYQYGRPVSEFDIAKLVRDAVGTPEKPIDGAQKIAEMIDLMLLEFKSLTNEDPGSPMSEFRPDSISFLPGELHNAEDGMPLGGLADELEGPDPLMPSEPQPKPVTAWFRGLLPR